MKYNKKIKLIETVPKISREELFANQKCFVAISLNNDFFQGYKLDLLLRWIPNKFNSCRIIVADYLYRHNIEIFEGENSDKIEKALSLGDKFLLELDKYLPKNDCFEIVRWRELISRPDFRDCLDVIELMFRDDLKFKNSIQNTATDYLDRLIKRGSKINVSYEKALDLSIKFIIEECAVYTLLGNDGYYVDIYPGTYLQVLNEIALGDFPEAPEALKNKINVKIKTVKK